MRRHGFLSLLALCCILPAQAQVSSTLQPTTTLTTQLGSLTVVAAPDPMLVRINGAQAIVAKVFPAMVNRSGQFNRDISILSPWSNYRDVPGARITLSSWVSDVRLRVPVEADDVVAGIMPAAAGQARINTSYRFDKARLSFKFNVRSSTSADALRALSTVMQRMATIEDSFQVELFGVGGRFDFTAGMALGRVRIERIEQFTLQLDGVTVEDTGWLTEIANFFLGFDRVFNVSGASNVNQAATMLANRLLQEAIKFSSLLQDNLNHALWTVGTPQFALHAVPIPGGATLGLGGTLRSLSSAASALRLDWDVAASAQPDGAVPTLAYSKLVRLVEDLTQIPAEGDLQVFVPYSLADQAMFELAQAGLLRNIGVPSASQGGVGQGFAMNLAPTGMPRTYRDGTNPGLLVVRLGVRMENATVSSVNVYGSSVPGGIPSSLSVTTVDATADLAIVVQPLVRADTTVDLRIVGVSVTNLAGQLRVATTTTNLALHQPAIQSAIDLAIRRSAPTVPLVSRAMSLPAPFSVNAGPATLGSMYARVPVVIVVN